MHQKTISEVITMMQSRFEGLTNTEVVERRKKQGSNILPQSHETLSRARIFLNQFKSPLIAILCVTGAVSGILGEWTDMSVIFITVLVNVVVGFIQEYKANEALKKLSNMIEYKAVVLRNGKKIQIPGTDIVPGDIMLLEAGDKIQADGRIIYEKNLEVQEASLTGESEPQAKQIRELSVHTPLADRTNMVYRGTIVNNGRARVVVVATGSQTEIGHIAKLVQETKSDNTPLQKQLARVAKFLGILVLGISVSIIFLGVVLRSGDHTMVELFQTAIAVAVAAIPEGLAISMTVILAIGMQHILKHRALVRKLLAAETLGSVSVICTDKTGTLTEGNMSITRVITSRGEVVGDLLSSDIVHSETYADYLLALRIGITCNDGVLENPFAPPSDWRFVGDTTDIAFVRLGMKIGLRKHEIDDVLARVDEIPFDSTKKYMASLFHIDHESVVYVKGAAEKVYAMCSWYEENGTPKKMTDKQGAWFESREKELTDQGLRVLAVAYRQTNALVKELHVKDLADMVLVGLIGISDPLRSDVAETIVNAQKAGLRIIMITGDHVYTAAHIASELGIPCAKENIFDGTTLESISDEELSAALAHVSVFARVDPKHKIRIVQALQHNGEVVAMTGDGVNDAPALKAADIGIAVGSGTDVAKEIADMVLLDDSFNTIVEAIAEGRGIYQNIKKVIVYLLAGSLAEVVLILGSLIGGMPLALLPAQVLWMNLIQEGFIVMALGFDKGDKENMQESPRKKDASLFDKQMKMIIAIISIIPNIVLFSLFVYYLRTTGDIHLTRTLMFVGIGINAFFYIFSIRSMRRMVWRIKFFDNTFLLLSLLISWIVLFATIYVPSLQMLLHTVPLTPHHWLVMGGFGLLSLVLVEAVKSGFISRAVRFKV